MRYECPLFHVAGKIDKDCITSICAWWSRQKGECAILGIAKDLQTLNTDTETKKEDK